MGIDVEHEAGAGFLAVDEGPRAAIRRQPLGQRPALGGRDRAEEAEDVLACIRHLEGTSHDLVLGRRGDVLRPARVVRLPSEPVDRPEEDGPQAELCRVPRRRLGLLGGPPFVGARALGQVELARAQAILGGDGVVVAAVPAVRAVGSLVPCEQRAVILRHDRQELVELVGLHPGRQRAPAVPVAQQDQEVRPRRHPLAARDLLEADRDRPLVKAGLLAHAPAQVDCLEAGPARRTELLEPGEDVRLEPAALLLEILEGRADEDAKCPAHLARVAGHRLNSLESQPSFVGAGSGANGGGWAVGGACCTAGGADGTTNGLTRTRVPQSAWGQAITLPSPALSIGNRCWQAGQRTMIPSSSSAAVTMAGPYATPTSSSRSSAPLSSSAHTICGADDCNQMAQRAPRSGSCPTTSPVATSQTRSVLSLLAETMKCPSGENAHAITGSP